MTNQAIDDKNRQRLLNLRVELEELEAISADTGPIYGRPVITDGRDASR